MNILVVVAHPDDEVLGCGGILPLLARQGHIISILILAIRHLVREAHQAGHLLQAENILCDEFPDQLFETVFQSLIHRIDNAIRTHMPAAIYTHHPGDLNLDHSVTARAVLTATRPQQECPVKELYTCEVPSSTEWGFNYDFKPNVFVDIHETLELKLKAMDIYASETRAFPHPRSPEALASRATFWGSVAGVQAAEAFQLLRSVR